MAESTTGTGTRRPDYLNRCRDIEKSTKSLPSRFSRSLMLEVFQDCVRAGRASAVTRPVPQTALETHVATFTVLLRKSAFFPTVP